MEPREASGTCAILFTDLVDSTALRARVGEEAADRWIIEAEGRARDLVQARPGWVVKGTGDGVLAAFDSAANALAAAVAFQQRTEYPMRIRVSIGDVPWRQGDCFGHQSSRPPVSPPPPVPARSWSRMWCGSWLAAGVAIASSPSETSS